MPTVIDRTPDKTPVFLLLEENGSACGRIDRRKSVSFPQFDGPRNNNGNVGSSCICKDPPVPFLTENPHFQYFNSVGGLAMLTVKKLTEKLKQLQKILFNFKI